MWHNRYNGFSPQSTKNVIQWQWPDYNPTMQASSSALRCNGGRSAPLSASAAPGDSVTAIWGQWTHSQGPILVWMYKCAGAFASCDGSGAGWFKIDEAGFHGGSGVFLDSEKGSAWDIAKLVGGDKQWTSTIPAAVTGVARMRPSGPNRVPSTVCDSSVTTGGRSTVRRWINGAITLPSSVCTAMNRMAT